MNSNHEHSWEPDAESLSAYFDGELGPVERRRIQEWLANHPEGVADLEAYGQIQQLSRRTKPCDLSEGEWAAVFDRVDREWSAARSRLTPSSGKRALASLPFAAVSVLAGLAAALLFVVSMPAPNTTLVEDPEQVVTVEGWPVAGMGDVEIVSVDGSDTSCLVVGLPPVRGVMAFVGPDEIDVLHTFPSSEGAVTTVRVQGNSVGSRVMATVDMVVQSGP